MKKIILLTATLFTIHSCDVAKQVAGEILLPTEGTKTGLTNTEVISGLKEALGVAIKNSTSLASKLDGFNSNNLIKLPFPEDAIEVKNFLIDKGIFTAQVSNFETTLNRAAEDASAKAAPIFMDAITSMSISDGFAILRGGEGAATSFLKEKTTAKLIEAFSPVAKNSIEKVELTKFWNPIVTKYNLLNTLTGKKAVNPDLDQYVTNKAVEGLFTMMALEENKIRKDPAARVSDVLRKVFGSLDK
jgi:hypothetical protein